MAVGGCAGEAANGRRYVDDLELKGVDHVSRGDLEEGLATEETGWWPFASKHWFDRAALDADLKRIVAFYADHGYFDARVVDHQVRNVGRDEVHVTISVEEGAPTHVTRVSITGLEGVDARDRDWILRKLPVREKDVFVYDELESAKRRIERRLKQRGYAYAQVKAEGRIDREQREAELLLAATPGPQVHFADIQVKGNGNIPAHGILNRVTWDRGELFEPEQLTTTQGRLYNLGVFSSVRVDLDPVPKPNPTVTIEVAPGRLHELRLGGGVGVERRRQEARLRAEWTLNNFLGGLRTLRLRVKPAYVVIPDIFDMKQSGIAAENDLMLRQPDLFSSRFSATGLIGYDLGIAEGYQYHGPRAQLGVERPLFRDRVTTGVSWNLQYLDFFNVDPTVFNPLTTPLGFGFKDPYRLVYLEEYVALELRDRPLAAREGGYAMVRFEQGTAAVGGDFTYLKISPELRGYLPLGRRVTLAGRASLGWLGPDGRVESPITRRFALGGPSSHRGFGFGRLAPQVVTPTGRRVPVGGDGMVLFSLETRIDVVKVAGHWLGLVPFFDAGDVTPTFSDLDLGELHLATGSQLDYETPIGVVRVGLGVRLNRLDAMGPGGLSNPDPGDRLSFFFSIGEAF